MLQPPLPGGRRGRGLAWRAACRPRVNDPGAGGGGVAPAVPGAQRPRVGAVRDQRCRRSSAGPRRTGRCRPLTDADRTVAPAAFLTTRLTAATSDSAGGDHQRVVDPVAVGRQQPCPGRASSTAGPALSRGASALARTKPDCGTADHRRREDPRAVRHRGGLGGEPEARALGQRGGRGGRGIGGRLRPLAKSPAPAATVTSAAPGTTKSAGAAPGRRSHRTRDGRPRAARGRRRASGRSPMAWWCRDPSRTDRPGVRCEA